MESGYRDLAACYSVLFPLNDRQRSFFDHLARTGPAASVIDVGCGTGEHLAWFSARGVRACGLEPDAAMFRELSRRSWPGPAPALLKVGAEALPGAVAGAADLVLCLGNTLPHLPGRDAAGRAVRGMAKTLAPGGRLVVQTVNFDRILAEGKAAFPVIERTLPDGGRVALLREYDLGEAPERILFRTRLETPGRVSEAAWPLVPLRRDELLGFLEAAGLTAAEAFGDYDRTPFSMGSPALLLVARRERRGEGG